MKIWISSINAIFWLIISVPVFAHPVSYKDGIGIMPEWTEARQDLEINYSFEGDRAFGFSFIRLEGQGRSLEYYLPRYNYRLYRRNQPDSQSNIYLSAGAGLADTADDTSLAGMGIFQADYETRRIYSLFQAEYLQGEQSNDFSRLRYRAGIAPYLAEFDEFNTWVIVQTDYSPDMDEEFTVTPLFRLFYDNYLLEAGMSLDGELMLAGIFHF